MKKIIKIVLVIISILIIVIIIYGKTQNKTVSAEIIINATKENVWETWSKFYNVDQYVPGISKSQTIGNVEYGLGHLRRCDIAENVYVEEEITAWDMGNSFSMEVYKVEGVPIDKMAVNYFVSKNENRTKATIVMKYKMKGLIDFIPIKSTMEQQAIDHLIGIKHLVETGNKLNQQKLEELRKTYSSFYKTIKN